MAELLKIYPEYFQAVIDGKKTFEIRYNDRNFKAGKYYILEEYKGKKHFPTCPDYYICNYREYMFDEDEDIKGCPINRDDCNAYKKDIYTGRRCLIKIKDIFNLDKALPFENYVAFTFDIINIQEK